MRKRGNFYYVDGRKLRSARGDRKAADVARELDVSRCRYCDWEKGRKRVSSDVLAAIERVLHVRPIDLVIDTKIFA